MSSARFAAGSQRCYHRGMARQLIIWLLNPYHAGSHRAWAEGYAAHSRHAVHLVAMPGVFWKWRLMGGAMELAAQAEALLEHGERPDVILASSMTNLPAFLALERRQLAATPTVLFMHENQLTYPPPPGAKRDLAYGLIQHLSMLTADRVCFNSRFHLEAWFAEAPRLLKHFPDHTHLESIAKARAKSSVLPVGCDLRRLDAYAPHGGKAPGRPPLLLWNQRWEHDKNPGAMLGAVVALAEEGLRFNVALAGERFRVEATEFERARAALGERLVHYGYAPDDAAYARLLWAADVTFSTAIHEFFGIGVVEALYCGATPVLPARLSYPELVPEQEHAALLYVDQAGLLERLRSALSGPSAPATLRAHVAQFDWELQAPAYDALLEEVSESRGGARPA